MIYDARISGWGSNWRLQVTVTANGERRLVDHDRTRRLYATAQHAAAAQGLLVQEIQPQAQIDAAAMLK